MDALEALVDEPDALAASERSFLGNLAESSCLLDWSDESFSLVSIAYKNDKQAYE